MQYAASTNSFYHPDAHSVIPADAKPVPADLYAELAGKLVRPGQGGLPELAPAPVIVETVPTSVTMYQARYVLIEDGLDDDVESAIEKIENPIQKKKARAAWEYATTVDRDSEFTQFFAMALELSDAQLDSLFMRAGKVK